MSVRLKIRGKLVLSFSVVMMLVLTGLGYITYLTFADSIHAHKQQIATVKLDNIRLRIHQALSETQQALQHGQFHLLRGTLPEDVLKTILMETPSRGVAVIDNNGQLAATEGDSDGIAALSSKVRVGAQGTGTLHLEGDSLIIMGTPFEPDQNFLLATSIPEQALLEQIKLPVAANDDQDMLSLDNQILLSRNGQLMLSSGREEAQQQARLDRLGAANIEDALTRVDDVFAIRKPLPELDLTLWYLIDEADYLRSIIELKNRIVAATIVILWGSIWIVLIVAYRIARPIRALSNATHEMQKSQYSVPLKFNDSGDEVGDLGFRFEKMRLHIEGLISRDALSNLFNRRYLMHALELEVSKSIRTGNPLCCLMMDLDHFKGVNDTYGHQCGDAVIKQAAAVINEQVRDYDISARYGGEEFIVILPLTPLACARDVGDRIRQALQDNPITWEGKTLTPTMSVGVAEFSDPDDRSGEQMISAADAALYKAKETGRNRVAVSETKAVFDQKTTQVKGTG